MMLVVRALKINQLADGGMPPTCDSAVVAGERATKNGDRDGRPFLTGKIVLFGQCSVFVPLHTHVR